MTTSAAPRRGTRIAPAYPAPAAGTPLLVVGAPFSGATTLAWALGHHPELEPVVGAERAGRLVSALRRLEEDLRPILAEPDGAAPVLELRTDDRPRGFVVGGPELASRRGLLRSFFPELRVVHVHRPADEVVPLLVEASRHGGGRLTERGARAIWSRNSGECLAAEEGAGDGRALRLPYHTLVHEPQTAIRRALALLGKDPTSACVWPLRLLTTAPSGVRRGADDLAAVQAASPQMRGDAAGHAFHRRLRQLVEAVVPPGATVLVASRGEDELLRFRSRIGAHFPQAGGGEWAGFYPADGRAAVEHLDGLAAAGASHLLFPKPALWWLDHYPELREHLERSARLVACDTELAVVWALADTAQLELPESLETPIRTPSEPENSRAFLVKRRDAPPRRRRRLGGSLWAVTTFYNPVGYRSKKENYDRFRAGVAAAGVPLLTVELAFGEAPFELTGADAERIVSLRGRDVLWQKERLLNIGVRHLPEGCDKVAWLDADLHFARPDWAPETARLLESHVVVQPFSHSVRLPPGELDCEPAMLPFGAGEGQLFYGIAWGVQAKGRRSLTSYGEHGHTGFAWAARRLLLEEHGLYDANLLGNGDTDIAHAMFGSGDYWALRKLSGEARAHLQRWADPFAKAVGSSVAHVDGVVTHLWHGEAQHRLYDRPLDVLHGFDPDRDLATDANGLLRLTDSASPELRVWLHDYFAVRREDG